MCRAELAWRLPPRLRRWRCVFPMRADAAHHGEARLGAEPIRVIPNGDHYCACVLGAHAFELADWRAPRPGDDEPVEFSDLVVDVEDSAGEGLQGELGQGLDSRPCPASRPHRYAASEVADLVRLPPVCRFLGRRHRSRRPSEKRQGRKSVPLGGDLVVRGQAFGTRADHGASWRRWEASDRVRAQPAVIQRGRWFRSGLP